MQVNWIKCSGGVWCGLERVDLETVNGSGVYMIWYSGNPGRVVYVGQGDIADRLRNHRNDPTILAYRQFGELLVTWASVSANQRDGVERYLADTWNPAKGTTFPNAAPIPVNSPFG